MLSAVGGNGLTKLAPPGVRYRVDLFLLPGWAAIAG